MRIAGVVGWPVAHSKSPLIHRFWLAKLGLDGDYSRFAVHPDRLGDAVRALPALGLAGVNVTVPHKVAVMAHLDRVDALAATVGAVNTVVVEDGALAGHNTDVEGFMAPLRRMLAATTRPADAPRLELIGTGGAARAVARGWLREHDEITIFGRDPAKVERFVAGLDGGVAGAAGGVAGLGGSVAGGVAGLVRDGSGTVRPGAATGGGDRGTIVVVNATTLGMTGNPPLAIDLDFYPDDTIVYDLVYAPLETPLLAAARARGLRTIDGLAMLIGQAAAAFELFFAAPAPRADDAELRAILTDKSL